MLGQIFNDKNHNNETKLPCNMVGNFTNTANTYTDPCRI